MLKKLTIILSGTLLFMAALSPKVYAQPDTVRVVCLGNSITEGYTTSNPATDSYPAQLGTLLGQNWLVMNGGVSGRTMLRHGDYPLWNEQKFADALAFNPDIVTIMLGTNDSKEWNWDYKEEFVNDYKAMIDTFRALPSQPVVWVCYPPPAFNGSYGINDSIIITDIVPMIQQVATDKGCPVIDFYTPMQSLSYLFPDGIHPNTAGSATMAELFYSSLTATAITEVKDENAAVGRMVSVSGSIDPLQYGAGNLVDGNNLTVWKTTGFPGQAIVDLGSVQSIDLLRVDFGIASRVGYQFLVETSADSDSWISALDLSTRTDTAAIVFKKIVPVDARYVRLIVSGATYPVGDTITVAELRAIKFNNSAHAPVVTAKKIGVSGDNARYNITLLWPESPVGVVMLYRISSTAGLSAAAGYRTGSTFTVTNEYIKIGRIYTYYAVSFLNGVKCTSDTLVVDTNPTAMGDTWSPALPAEVILRQAYPNPFNPSTTISFALLSRSLVALKIYDISGREITTLLSAQLAAGNYSKQWDASNMTSGVYFYRLQAGNYDKTKKIILLK
jgi:lysophospholipase L1-like esterase